MVRDVPAPPSSWIEAQQVALGARFLAASSKPNVKEQQRLLSLVWPRYKAWNGIEDTDYVERLRTFPPAALHALSSKSLTEKPQLLRDWERHRPLWHRELNTLTHRSGNLLPQVASAKLIANRIVSGNLAPAQLIHIVRSELGCEWKQVAGIKDALAALIARLSTPYITIGERLDTLRRFRMTVIPDRWTLVENALLQKSYSWPLLVLKGASRQHCTLPIAIDVHFSNAPDERFRSRHIIDYSEWEGPLDRAITAAKEFWYYKHGAWDPKFRDEIAQARVTVDLTVAESILEPFQDGNDEFVFEGSSAELSLTLAILTNLLDKAAMETTCATGILGTPRKDKEGGSDYKVIEPDDVDIKVVCAEEFLFDKIIIPYPSKPIHSGAQLRVCRGKTLSDFAKHAFGQAWRHHRYVRCPDLAYAFKPPKKHERYQFMPQPEDQDVEEFFSRLSANKDPVLVERRASASTIARALYAVNTRAAAAAEEANRIPKEHVGSFAFVRVVRDEINDRFWQLIWDVIKGSPQAFFDFRFCVSRGKPARVLASELNRFDSTKDRPHRPPDILVIIGSEHLYGERVDIPNGPFARLQLFQLLKELRTGLRPTPVPGLTNFVGNTRVILVPEDNGLQRQPFEPRGWDPQLVEAIKRLSVFRYGFTYEMARLVLGDTEDVFEAKLQRLQHAGFIRWADGAGEYFLVTSWLEQGDDADTHFAAADAIAGFLTRDRDAARFDYREAFAPAWFHEAQWHLRQVARQNEERAFTEHERLSQIAELFGWTRIRFAALYSRGDGEELLEALDDHLAKVASLGWRQYCHPIELVWAAKFVSRLAHNARARNNGRRARELQARWRELLEWADALCANFAPDEHDACRYVVASTRICLLLSEEPNQRGLSWAKSDLAVTAELWRFHRQTLDPELFEFLGDREQKHGIAAATYLNDIWSDELRNGRKLRLETVIKYLGAAALAGIPPSPKVQEQLLAFARSARYVRATNDRTGLYELPHVQDRWNEGRHRFLARDFGLIKRGVRGGLRPDRRAGGAR